MLDLLAQVTSSSLSSDAKWIILGLCGAISSMSLAIWKGVPKIAAFIDKKHTEATTKLDSIDASLQQNNSLMQQMIDHNKEIKQHILKTSEKMVLIETHTKETKHAIQNLPCNPAEAPAKSKTSVKKEKEHSEEQY